MAGSGSGSGGSPTEAPDRLATGDADQSGPILPSKQRKKSQRPSWSCTECTRRKIKCNRIVPGCDQCLKRQKVHLCRLEADETSMLAAGDDVAQSSAPGAVRLASSTEYQALTQSLSAIRLKLFHLERVVASFVPQPGCFGDDGGVMYAFSAQGFAAAASGPSAGDPAENAGTSTLPTLSEDSLREAENTRVVDDDGEVEAAVTLEFLALGRDRKQDHFSRSELRRPDEGQLAIDSSIAIASDRQLPVWDSDGSRTGRSALDISASSPRGGNTDNALDPALLPSPRQSEPIIQYSLDRVGWQHGAVHSGSFLAECTEFNNWSPAARAEQVNPAWLALFYAVLCVGVKHMTAADGQACGLSTDDLKTLPKRYFDASVAALHKSNFLAKHSIYAVQTIVILVLTCQDVGPSDLIATLLACAIRIAIHLNIHRFTGDKEWEQRRRRAGVEPNSPAGIKQLIDREVRKRLWAALCTEEWVSYPYRHSCSIFPSHFTTPLPNNVLDEDLARGQMIIRGPSEPTPVSKLITMFQTASCLRRFFEDTDNAQGGASYELCLQVDREIRDIIQRAPTYLQPNADLTSLPPFARWMNHYFIMSVSHKLLVIHRVFLGAAFKDPRYSYSRKAAIGAARTIIRELIKGSHLPFQHVWTVPYHAIVGATTLILDVYQCSASDPRDDVANKRYEVEMAIAELRILSEDSPIAARGVQLLSTLLAEEAKSRGNGGRRASNKRTASSAEMENFGEVAKRVASSSGLEGSPSAGRPSPAATPTAVPDATPLDHGAQQCPTQPASAAFDALLLQAGIHPQTQDQEQLGFGVDSIDFWRMLDATAALDPVNGPAPFVGELDGSTNAGADSTSTPTAAWAASLPYEFGGHGGAAGGNYDGLGWI